MIKQKNKIKKIDISLKNLFLSIGFNEGFTYESILTTPFKDYEIYLVENKLFAIPSWMLMNLEKSQ